jgi:hypothetical protein
MQSSEQNALLDNATLERSIHKAYELRENGILISDMSFETRQLLGPDGCTTSLARSGKGSLLETPSEMRPAMEPGSFS